MKKTVFKTTFLAIALSFLGLNAQEKPYQSSQIKGTACRKFDKDPSYAKGENAFRDEIIEYINQNSSIISQAKQIFTCELRFEILPSGKLRVIDTNGDSPEFNQEVERAVIGLKSIWKPAELDGALVSSSFKMPILSEKGPMTEAKFEGGINEFRQLISNKIKINQDKTPSAHTAVASFVISPEGALTQLNVEGINKSFNQEITRCITEIKKPWKPAIEDGKAVSADIKIPFKVRY